MHERISAFENHVREAASNPAFVHHEWFVQYHLELVARIALELLECYPAADRDCVSVLVWLHDYGKILDFDNQYNATLTAGRKRLSRIGFEPEFIDTVLSNAEMLDRKMDMDLHEAPLEVQIVSSADGAAHHVGPFMPEFWRENAGWSVEELMEGQRRKTMKDWDRKMVLSEVRAAFEWRHRAALEQAGELPERFLAP